MYKKSCFVVALLIVLHMPILAYKVDNFKLDQLMSPSEQKLTGVDRLSDSQRLALEKWLTNWSIRLLSSGPQGITKAKSNDDNSNDSFYSDEDIQLRKIKIKQVGSGGSQLILNDDTIWNIFPIDYAEVSNWLPNDKIQVKTSGNSSYPYRIYNLNTGASTIAALASDENEENKPSVEEANISEKIHKETFKLESIDDDGATIVLNDDSIWEIAPSAQYKTRNWNLGSKMSVHKNGEMFFPYTITNKNNGQTVFAKPFKSSP